MLIRSTFLFSSIWHIFIKSFKWELAFTNTPNHKKHIIGITCHNSKYLIKKAIKDKADYIALGAFFLTKTKKTKYKANIKILNWTKKTTNIPIVAIGGIKLNNYKKLLLNKVNFLAISGYVWNNNKYKPVEAIKKIKWKY